MTSILTNAQKILCLSNSNPSNDAIIATYVLASNLKRILGKEVDIASPSLNFYSEYIQSDEIKVISKLQPVKYIISISGQSKEIKDVQWDQAEDKLKLYITTDEMKVGAENIQCSTTGSNYDTLIVIGANILEDIGLFYTNSSGLFERARIINIDNNPSNTGYGNEKFITDNTSSLSETVFLYLEQLNASIDARSASLLLSGIFDTTKRFRNGVKSPYTFDICSRLARLGGDTAWAASKVVEKMTGMIK